MIVAAIVALAGLLMLVRIVRRKRKRADTGDSLAELLDVQPRYRGRRWNVGEKPWL